VASARTGLLFAVAALALTWPLAVSPGEAIAARDDYWSNLWNAWWMRRALFDLHVGPYWTDQLFYPVGLSLARHTLSPLNALAGAVASYAVSPATAYNLLLWTHFWLSGWTAFALARYETGSDVGAVIAGLLYAFCPIHYFYLAQINVATFEFLPLIFLFLLKTFREGGVRNAAGAMASAGLLAASSLYFAVYAGFFGLLLLAAAPLWRRGDAVPGGARRLLATGVGAALVVVGIAWPLLAGWASADAGAATLARRPAGSDLLGFNWSGTEGVLVSWPGMLGYSALILAAAGIRGWRGHGGWILVGALFWVLGLGSSLHVAGADTGIPLPYALVAETPLLGLLRMSNRFFVVTQLAFAVLCAAAWKDVSRRCRGPRRRAVGGAAAAAAIALELTCVPLGTFETRSSPYWNELAASPTVRSLIELPPYHAASFLNGRYVYHQTLHGKKIAQGYVTALAVSADVAADSRAWLRAYRELLQGDPEPLAKRVREQGIDRVVLNKRVPRRIPEPEGPHALSWRPFVWVRNARIRDRQRGHLREERVPAPVLAVLLRGLARELGEPVYRDDAIVVFAGGTDE
jgi:hypothetical protein